MDVDRKLIVPNTSLYGLKCEKVLPQNGGPKKEIPSKVKEMMSHPKRCCSNKSGYKKGTLYSKDPSGKKRKDFKGPKRAMGGVIDFNSISQKRKKVSNMNKGGMARACGAIMEGKRKITKFS